jgi:DNA polymerase-1
VVEVLNFPQFEKAGFEADDIIGTLAHQLGEKKSTTTDDEIKQLQAVIVTGDKDTFQLVNDWVHVWLPARGKIQIPQEYDIPAVEAKMGVHPSQVVDLKALMGDASDNIPGVKGIGAKTAAKLIQAFGDLESVYRAVDQVQHKQPGQQVAAESILKGSLLTKLVADRDQAMMSQSLATILIDVPVKLDLPACKVSGYNKHRALELFDELSFRSLEELLPSDDFELDIQAALF